MLNEVDGVVGGHEIGNGVILVILLPDQSLLRLFCLLNVLDLCSATQHVLAHVYVIHNNGLHYNRQ